MGNACGCGNANMPSNVVEPTAWDQNTKEPDDDGVVQEVQKSRLERYAMQNGDGQEAGDEEKPATYALSADTSVDSSIQDESNDTGPRVLPQAIMDHIASEALTTGMEAHQAYLGTLGLSPASGFGGEHGETASSIGAVKDDMTSNSAGTRDPSEYGKESYAELDSEFPVGPRVVIGSPGGSRRLLGSNGGADGSSDGDGRSKDQDAGDGLVINTQTQLLLPNSMHPEPSQMSDDSMVAEDGDSDMSEGEGEGEGDGSSSMHAGSVDNSNSKTSNGEGEGGGAGVRDKLTGRSPLAERLRQDSKSGVTFRNDVIMEGGVGNGEKRTLTNAHSSLSVLVNANSEPGSDDEIESGEGASTSNSNRPVEESEGEGEGVGEDEEDPQDF